MKKIIIIILINVLLNNLTVKGNTVCFQDTLLTYLSSLNLASFEDKPVDTFIAKIPTNYTSMKIFGGSREDYAGVLIIEYPGNVFIKVRVFEFTHMNPANPNKLPPSQAWNLALFRKEKVGYIIVYNNIHCVNGCENE